MALVPAFLRPRCMVRLFRYPLALIHSSRPEPSKPMSASDLEALLAEPTWSVESLLPQTTHAADIPSISAKQLHHLLRLSALPLPEKEKIMLDTLSAQLHFVGEIQRVDTMGVKPLRAIRDESGAAEWGQTITMDSLKAALSKEKVIGKHYKRIQRDATPVGAIHAEAWPVLASATRSVGKYFVVESERSQE